MTEEDEFYFNPGGPDDECEEHLTVEENDGASTQEIYSDSGEIIYRNGRNEDNE